MKTLSFFFVKKVITKHKTKISVLMQCRFPNLSKKLRLRIQTMQNKCIRFYLQLDKMSRTCVKKSLELNCLNVHDR